MLITFSCPAYANITLFGEVAIRLLKMMGHSETVPGALLADDVPAALARLEKAIADGEQTPTESGYDDEPDVNLAHRALPVIELLRAAAKDHCNVMWDSGT
ncbi:protein of unknown function [Amphritea atlantica]|uniref:DUF1840 domain-containing protein n=1 Tax=Amphritea atlantica TaxID=355243 RepID=A0A1H9JF52_9GAMM|nr:DUF1840 domain-containing protein [Amphritea atlantica]SEQ85418.1 protein of unknown function [Amphritea atlantica]